MNKERMLAFLNSLGPMSFIGFIFLQMLQVVAAPIPGEVTGFIGGYLYGPALGIVLSTIGLTIGSMIAFGLSRYSGTPFVEKFINKETMAKYDYLLHHRGAFLVFLLFVIPGTPKDFLCYIVGLGHLTVMEFFVISTIGRLAGTVLITLRGDYIRHEKYQSLAVLLTVSIVLIFFSMLQKENLQKVFHHLHRKSREQPK
jgi:uncharacterized membrane protein YdjX (TVP38/TMEM64 family)